MEDAGHRFVEPDVDPAWQDPVLVVCPRCEGMAVARRREGWTARLVCVGCGLTRDWPGAELRTEEGVDARFGAPLWLRATCCGGKLLWANNEAHLDHLGAFVGARLREHATGPAPLSAKLPGWMKDAKNRDEVLRHLGRLRQRLEASSTPADDGLLEQGPGVRVSPIREGTWVDDAGTRWRLRGRGQPTDTKRVARLLRDADVRVLHIDGPGVRTDVAPGDRTLLWARIEPYLRDTVDREPNDQTDVVVGEFKDDQGRSLLVIDETC